MLRRPRWQEAAIVALVVAVGVFVMILALSVPVDDEPPPSDPPVI